MDSKYLLKAKDLAERIGISERTLRRMRSEMKGPPFVKVGGSVRYDWKKCLKYFDKRTVEPEEFGLFEDEEYVNKG